MRVWWPCVLCLIFIYYVHNCFSQSGIGLLRTYQTLCGAAKNEKISHTPGRCVHIAWQ